jgi:predicted Zn-dependent protease with MMP-like domain
MNDEEFEQLVGEAIDNVPEPYRSRLQNVAFIVEDEPSPEQRQKTGLHPYQTLFGLYEGVPLPQRGGTTKLLPDKITVFKNPILTAFPSKEAARAQIFQTIWHEVAHYFGLDHKRIQELESGNSSGR